MSRTIILRSQLAIALATPPPDFLSVLPAEATEPDREAFLDTLRGWRGDAACALRESGLWELMSPDERSFLTASPEAVPLQALTDVTWLMESAECLLWALGYVEVLPPYDAQADVDHLQRLPVDRTVRELQLAATLRDAKTIEGARALAELWHWRSRTRQLIERGTPVTLPQGLELRDVIRMAAEEAASRGDIAAVIDGDFPAFGRGYNQASSEEWAQLTSIAMERHRALNWLCGYAPRNRWQDTPTGT